MASDMYRHTGKFCFAPDSVNLTALGGDGDWKSKWLDYARGGADLIIAITCRVESPLTRQLVNLDNVILFAPDYHDKIPTVRIESTYYHEFECRSLYAMYMLMQQTGVSLPTLPKIVQNNIDVSVRDNVYCIDIDGNVYETVQIGEQVWMAENLKVTHYNDGYPIPTGYFDAHWTELATGAYAVYDDDPTNADIYGNLYTKRSIKNTISINSLSH